MPKVVFIMTDSQRYDMVNANVETGLATPNLDKLAGSGMKYERAYTVQPVCQPARAALFTGLFPHSCNSWTNSVGLSSDVKSIGERLTDKGIRSAYIGKWHLDGGDYFGKGVCPKGWDPEYWYDMKNYLDELTEEERVLSRDEKNMYNMDFSSEFTFAHRCSDRAIKFLEEHGEEDFFLSVSYDEPHHPYICPREYWEKYVDFEFPVSPNTKDTLEGKPDYQLAWAGDSVNRNRDDIKIKQAFYFGCNSFVDHQIGRVLDAVQKLGDDVYVIYTSDHGDALESHCISGKGPTVYDEIARIPLFISGKGIAPGASTAVAASHIDIAPTIFEMFNLNQPNIFEGSSMLALSRQQESGEGRYSFIEFGRYEIDHDGFGGFQPLRAVFDGRYKLSINLLSRDEFYDLELDPHEMHNKIDSPEYYEEICRLHDVILDKMNKTRDPFRGYYWERRPFRKDCADASWDYTGYTRQSENEDEPRQLDYATGLEMVKGTRKKKVIKSIVE